LQAKWDFSLQHSVWADEREHYPEFAKWFEGFMTRLDNYTPTRMPIVHTTKVSTETAFKEAEDLIQGIL
jgi:hypothetical protein